MGDLYDTDVLESVGSSRLGCCAFMPGARSQEAPDWDNIIEEIESVGREQLHSVEGLLLQAMLHELKAQAWPGAQDAEKWRGMRRCSGRRRHCGSSPPCGGSSIWTGCTRKRFGDAGFRRRQPPGPVPDACPWSLASFVEDADEP